MATWSEFAGGAAEVQRPAGGGERTRWEPLAAGAAALAEAGARLLEAGELAMLGTVTKSGRPRLHPFIPQLLDGRLYAFIGRHTPKYRDLLARQYAIHALPGAEDEEFWASGRALLREDPELIARVSEAMPFVVRLGEALFEFDLERAGWTTWIGFGSAEIRPQHHRWRA